MTRRWPAVCGSTATVFLPRRWPTVCGATATKLYGSALPQCAVRPPLPLNAGSTTIPDSETGRVPVACVVFNNHDAWCAAGAPYSTRAVVVAEGPVLPEPPPPTTGLCGADFHSWHFMPPVCTGAVMVSGSDARSQESGQSCAHDPAACAPDCLLVPLMGRWTPYWGAGRWTP